MSPARNRLASVLRQLAEHGFQILVEEPDQALIRDRDENDYVLTGAEDWVQAAILVVEAKELKGPFFHEATELALRLHSRFLGCRLGLDDEENLAVQYDIYPDLPVGHILLALGQLHYIGSVTSPLFREVLGGSAVNEDRIDHAFDAF
jgi:hypothetical protein